MKPFDHPDKKSRMNIAVILAGGVGSRLGADIPKQFIKVLDKPVLAYTIEAFQRHPQIDAIEVVCHADWKDYLSGMIEEYGLSKVKWVADGGDTFQQSVINGVYYLEGKIDPEDIILIHFGASPFVTPDLITDAIRVCGIRNNAISSTDYLLLSAFKKTKTSGSDPDNYAAEYINRDTIACMNSPHAFRHGFILDMYKEAIETGVINEVEPHTTTLMHKMGKKIYFSKGSQTNIKITRKEDLDLFEGYVLMKKRRGLWERIIIPE